MTFANARLPFFTASTNCLPGGGRGPIFVARPVAAKTRIPARASTLAFKLTEKFAIQALASFSSHLWPASRAGYGISQSGNFTSLKFLSPRRRLGANFVAATLRCQKLGTGLRRYDSVCRRFQ